MKWLDGFLIAVLIVSCLPMPAADARATAMGLQDEEPAAESAEPAQAGAESAEAGDETDSDFARMEQILEDEEQMIEGAYTYDAGRRRDPFVSLLDPGPSPDLGPRGECPIGCLIDEITLTGIFVMPEGPVAQILSADQAKSYLIRVGDEFHDGEVIEITPRGVRFRQMVNDFQEMKPYREVFMELNP